MSQLCFDIEIGLLQGEGVSAYMADINSSGDSGDWRDVTIGTVVVRESAYCFLTDALQPNTVCVPPLTTLHAVKLPSRLYRSVAWAPVLRSVVTAE